MGDIVQLGNYTGDLRYIGLRASVVRTLEGSDIIVPNGALISDKVVNWTLSDQNRRLEISVGVDYGADPEFVIDLLTKVANAHKDVLKEPESRTLFIGFGDNALDFQLRAWTNSYRRWQVVKSELTLGVHTALRDAGIAIPGPQRSLHVESISEQVLESLNLKSGVPGP